MKCQRIWISDTTLRDGEQAPGFSMSEQDKLEMALHLERLGVDRIEAGFPAASESDLRAVREIARAVRGSEVMAFSRMVDGDLEAAARALEHAARPVLHTFIPTSDLHLTAKLGWTRQQALDVAGHHLRRARRLFDDIQFAMEDASRSDPEFLAEVVALGVAEGVRTVNIADTVGYILPHEWSRLVERLLALPGMDRTILSVHCHDDLGLAVANSLAAVLAGARQVECTINGIGERAGNAALEEIVMALRTRDLGLATGIQATELMRTSRALSAITGVKVPPNKAIVGRNAFAHEAGIHQAGILENPLTYEIMRPEAVGQAGRNLVLGRHSGRHGLVSRLRALGRDVTPDEIDAIYERFCHLASEKKVVLDGDLVRLLNLQLGDASDHELVSVHHMCTGEQAIAAIGLRRGGETVSSSATAESPYEACAQAIRQIVGEPFDTQDVDAGVCTRGGIAVAHATVTIADRRGATFSGHARASDPIRAFAEAYLGAVSAALAIRRDRPTPRRVASQAADQRAESR